MKALLITLLVSFSISTFSTPVDGKIFYKLPDGKLVKREVMLEVPSRGEGEVILSGKSFEWKTKKFWTVKKAGKTSFYAAFKTEFMRKKSVILFKGTYIQGTNTIVYYGDFYKKKIDEEISEDSLDLDSFNFQGGFNFKYER